MRCGLTKEEQPTVWLAVLRFNDLSGIVRDIMIEPLLGGAESAQLAWFGAGEVPPGVLRHLCYSVSKVCRSCAQSSGSLAGLPGWPGSVRYPGVPCARSGRCGGYKPQRYRGHHN